MRKCTQGRSMEQEDMGGITCSIEDEALKDRRKYKQGMRNMLENGKGEHGRGLKRRELLF